MWREVVWFKPKLDEGDAKRAEKSLSERFARVSKRFGQGLQAVIKGSVLGISLGLLNKLLNPIQALEEKITNLLGQGTQLEDLADQFNTSPGEISRLQSVAEAKGLSPDQFREMLTKYGEAITTAREELKNPFGEVSGRTLALKNFVDEDNLAKSFINFLTSLRNVGQGEGSYAALSDRARKRMTDSAISGKALSEGEIADLLRRGELVKRSGEETRRAFEKEVFGQPQTGAPKRFINADVEQTAANLNVPSTEKFNEAVKRTGDLAAMQRALDVQNKSNDFVAAAAKVNEQMIQQIAAGQKAEMDRDTRQLESFNDLKKAAIAIDQVKGSLETLLVMVNKGIGFLADFANFAGTLKNSRLFRSMISKEK